MEWIFFDVGSALLDETESCDHCAREMLESTGVTFGKFNAIRISLSTQGGDGNSTEIEYCGLSITAFAGLGMAKHDPTICE